MAYRIGIGYDIHRLVRGRKLILGGVPVPYPLGLAGHSDADVLLHAVCDALLGGAGLADIGELFPDSDSRYRGADSVRLLGLVMKRVSRQKCRVLSLDAVIVAQEPKLIPYKQKIRARLCALLGVDESAVNIKAKTNEGLDSVGRGKAIAAYAVALINRKIT
jgi:2-C-methyl-D-erythritol 2,4-cyclodiphosphate synthase